MTDKKRLRVRNRAVLDAVAGATAGCIARFVVGPLDVLKIRFQASMPRLFQTRMAASCSATVVMPAVLAHACSTHLPYQDGFTVLMVPPAAPATICSRLLACPA